MTVRRFIIEIIKAAGKRGSISENQRHVESSANSAERAANSQKRKATAAGSRVLHQRLPVEQNPPNKTHTPA